MHRYALRECGGLSCGTTTYLMCSLSFPLQCVCGREGELGSGRWSWGPWCNVLSALLAFFCFLFFFRVALAIPLPPSFVPFVFCSHTMVSSCRVPRA